MRQKNTQNVVTRVNSVLTCESCRITSSDKVEVVKIDGVP